MHTGLGGLHRVVLVVDRRSRAGEVVDLVDLQEERVRHVVPNQLEVRPLEQVHDVELLAREEVVEANDSDALTLRQLQVIRRGRERGIYKAEDVVEVHRAAGPAVLGGHVSERLDCWRPKRSFFDRLIA